MISWSSERHPRGVVDQRLPDGPAPDLPRPAADQDGPPAGLESHGGHAIIDREAGPTGLPMAASQSQAD